MKQGNIPSLVERTPTALDMLIGRVNEIAVEIENTGRCVLRDLDYGDMIEIANRLDALSQPKEDAVGGGEAECNHPAASNENARYTLADVEARLGDIIETVPRGGLSISDWIAGRMQKAVGRARRSTEDAVGGGVPAGMVAYGPDHPDYPNEPADWNYSRTPSVRYRCGRDGNPAPRPRRWQHESADHDADFDIIAYTSKAAYSYDGDARERIARICDPDAWEHYDANIEIINRHCGNEETWGPLNPRYQIDADEWVAPSLAKADAILAALPTSDASERLREAGDLLVVTDDKGFITLHEPNEEGDPGDLVASVWRDDWLDRLVKAGEKA